MASLMQQGDRFCCQFVYFGKRHCFGLGKFPRNAAEAKINQMRLKQGLLQFAHGIVIISFPEFDGKPPAQPVPARDSPTLALLRDAYLNVHRILAWVHPLFCFVAHTCARQSQIIRTEADDVDFEAKTILIREKRRAHDKTNYPAVPEDTAVWDTIMVWASRRIWLERMFAPWAPSWLIPYRPQRGAAGCAGFDGDSHKANRIDPRWTLRLQYGWNHSRWAGGPSMRRSLAVCLVIPLAIVGFFLHTQAQTPQPIAPGPRVEGKNVGPRAGDKLSAQAQPIFFSSQRALEWLKLANKPDGRFVYGFQPALRVQLDGDNFQSQAGATLALARAARYYRDGRGAAIARQAALTLLELETMVDPQDATVRFTAAPPTVVERLSSNGLLISAIHELTDADKSTDLLDKADQLCNYLRQQQKPDGMLFVTVGATTLKSGSDEIDAERAGLALQGIIRSQKHRPAAWKLDTVRRARAAYHATWSQSKSLTTVCSHTPAYAEAYAQSRDAVFAETVFAMNDWLIGLQYREEVDSPRRHWNGGFRRCSGGKIEQATPDINSARCAESLAEACRVAHLMGDLPRYERYERALLENLHFLMSLQYNGAKTQHFVEAFRPSILGAFHASHQDGNIRIDYTQHSLAAMVQYLDAVAE